MFEVFLPSPKRKFSVRLPPGKLLFFLFCVLFFLYIYLLFYTYHKHSHYKHHILYTEKHRTFLTPHISCCFEAPLILFEAPCTLFYIQLYPVDLLSVLLCIYFLFTLICSYCLLVYPIDRYHKSFFSTTLFTLRISIYLSFLLCKCRHYLYLSIYYYTTLSSISIFYIVYSYYFIYYNIIYCLFPIFLPPAYHLLPYFARRTPFICRKYLFFIFQKKICPRTTSLNEFSELFSV